MKATPRNDSIFVVPHEPADRTKGGIILTDYSKRHPCEGVVVALGPAVKDTLLHVGTRVVYGPYAAHHLRVEIDFAGQATEAYIMNEHDIIAVLEDEEKT